MFSSSVELHVSKTTKLSPDPSEGTPFEVGYDYGVNAVLTLVNKSFKSR